MSRVQRLAGWGLALVAAWTAGAGPAATAAPPPWPAELRPLLKALERARYAVFLAPPPIPGAYGATDARRRLIWLAPIAIELGIARQALLHEAVHAAQACPKGKLTPIGWPLRMDPVVDREVSGLLYRGYAHNKHELEREAFAMQGQPQAMALVIQALAQRCR